MLRDALKKILGFILHFRPLGTFLVFTKKLNFAIIFTFTFGDRGPPPLKEKIPNTSRFLPEMNDGDSKSNEL